VNTDFFIARPEDLLAAFPNWWEVGGKNLKVKNPFTGKTHITWAPILRGGEDDEVGGESRPDWERLHTLPGAGLDLGAVTALLAAGLGVTFDDVCFKELDKPALIAPDPNAYALFEANPEFVGMLARLSDEGKPKLIREWKNCAEENGAGVSDKAAARVIDPLRDLARAAESTGQKMYILFRF
jgi:hypothetical protein